MAFNYQQPNNYNSAQQFVNVPSARNTQPLSQEQINQLQQRNDSFNLQVPQEEMWRAICTHKDKNGNSTLTLGEDNRWHCSICDASISMDEYSPQEVEESINKVIDMMQVAKTIYLDAPNDMIEQFFQMIPILDRFGQIWKHAVKNFQQYNYYFENGGVAPINPNYGAFAFYNSLYNNPYAGYNAPQPGYPQPGYPQQPIQPVMPYQAMPQQPAYNGYIQNMPNQNVMAYGTPANTFAAPPAQPPVAPPVGTIPAVGQAQPAPAPVASAPAPAAQPEVQQNQQFNV